MNLLEIIDDAIVSKTLMTRKLTIGGETKAYPVYKVRLDHLFYNDQNDRIATWITQYKNDAQNVPFEFLSREDYNYVIQQFIIDSNPAALEKTKNNIAIVNQREPGVVLADGRIVDGNRRFTCLRLLQEVEQVPRYFETVILNATAEHDQKQIKLLELAIQHGEEQRVDYNLIDMAIGAYHDIVETKLITVDEYVESTGISLTEVKRRLETATIIIEFLDFMGVPKQYHIAREMQVYSVFYEMCPLLKRCDSEESKNALKQSVFSNTMMGTFADQRKYIRDVKALMESGMYTAYMKKQSVIANHLEEKKRAAQISNQQELGQFVTANEELKEDFQISMERALLQSKKEQTKSRPSQLVNKSISTILDIDTRILDTLSEGEKRKFHAQLHKLSDAISMIQADVDMEVESNDVAAASMPEKTFVKEHFRLAERDVGNPFVCAIDWMEITTLSFSLRFTAMKYLPTQKDEMDISVYFVSPDYQVLCPTQEIHVRAGQETKTSFSLNASASSYSCCYLVIKSSNHSEWEAQEFIKYPMKIAFDVNFNF